MNGVYNTVCREREGELLIPPLCGYIWLYI